MSFSLSIWHGPNALESNAGTYSTAEEAARDAVRKSNASGGTFLIRGDNGDAVKAYRNGVEIELPEGANEEVIESDAKTKVR